jgi:hypothetical protein
MRAAVGLEVNFRDALVGRNAASFVFTAKYVLAPRARPAPVPARALAKLKFSACLPEPLARSVLTARLTDNASVQDTLTRPRRLVAARA